MARPFKKTCDINTCTGCISMHYIDNLHRYCYEERYELPTLKPERYQYNGKTANVWTGIIGQLLNDRCGDVQDKILHEANLTPLCDLIHSYTEIDIII